MGNPRIVRGRRGSDIALAVRGHVLDTVFLIGVPRPPPTDTPRMQIENRLLEEAKSLMRLAASEQRFEWVNRGFVFNEDFGVWEKRLSETEVAQLLRG